MISTQSRPSAGIAVCTPVGENDLATTALLDDALSVAKQGQNQWLLIDLSYVDFLGLAGIEVLLDAAARAGAAGRELLISVPNRQAWRLLELTGALDILTAHPSLDHALAAVQVVAGPAGRVPAPLAPPLPLVSA